MKRELAQSIAEQVDATHAGKIEATVFHPRNAVPGSFLVKLHLLGTANRKFILRYQNDLARAYEAWAIFLLSNEELRQLPPLNEAEKQEELFTTV